MQKIQSKSQLQVSPVVIGQRFRKAFPELASLSSWLSDGYRWGTDWLALLDAHVGALDQPRATELAREAHDVMAIGLSSDRDVHTLVCNVLGLDSALLSNEVMTATQFLIEVHERLVTTVPTE
jgi:hypothetical protein